MSLEIDELHCNRAEMRRIKSDGVTVMLAAVFEGILVMEGNLNDEDFQAFLKRTRSSQDIKILNGINYDQVSDESKKVIEQGFVTPGLSAWMHRHIDG